MFARVAVLVVVMFIASCSAFRVSRVGNSALKSLRGGSLKMSSTATPTSSIPKVKGESAKKMLEGVDSLIFDLDGVIFLGDTVIPGVPETLELNSSAGRPLVSPWRVAVKAGHSWIINYHKLILISDLTYKNAVRMFGFPETRSKI